MKMKDCFWRKTYKTHTCRSVSLCIQQTDKDGCSVIHVKVQNRNLQNKTPDGGIKDQKQTDKQPQQKLQTLRKAAIAK